MPASAASPRRGQGVVPGSAHPFCSLQPGGAARGGCGAPAVLPGLQTPAAPLPGSSPGASPRPRDLRGVPGGGEKELCRLCPGLQAYTSRPPAPHPRSAAAAAWPAVTPRGGHRHRHRHRPGRTRGRRADGGCAAVPGERRGHTTSGGACAAGDGGLWVPSSSISLEKRSLLLPPLLSIYIYIHAHTYIYIAAAHLPPPRFKARNAIVSCLRTPRARFHQWDDVARQRCRQTLPAQREPPGSSLICNQTHPAFPQPQSLMPSPFGSPSWDVLNEILISSGQG